MSSAIPQYISRGIRLTPEKSKKRCGDSKRPPSDMEGIVSSNCGRLSCVALRCVARVEKRRRFRSSRVRLGSLFLRTARQKLVFSGLPAVVSRPGRIHFHSRLFSDLSLRNTRQSVVAGVDVGLEDMMYHLFFGGARGPQYSLREPWTPGVLTTFDLQQYPSAK